MNSFDSCHRALYCLDILEAVLANLNSHDRKDRATCAQVALVCRRFSETALRSTWRVLPTFDPLWNIFLPVNVNRGNFNNPALAIRTHRISYSKWKSAQYDTQRYGDSGIWKRFLMYARSVREVLRMNTDFGSKDTELIRVLVAHNGGSTFLASLRSINWTQNQLSAKTLIELSCPSLLTLNVSNRRTKRDEIEALLPLLPSSFPALSTLVVGASYIPQPRAPPGTPLIPRFKNLRKLRVSIDLNWEDLRSLIGPLEELEFPAASPSNWSEGGALHAPNLRVLTCFGIYAVMRSLLSSLVAPKLARVTLDSVRYRECSTVLYRDVTATLAALASSKASLCIRSISLDYTGKHSDDDRNMELVKNVLHPCLKLTQLEELTVMDKGSPAIYCSDEGILSLAESLKNLKHLNLIADPYHPTRTVSLVSLVHLSRHCPQLTSIRLYLDIFFPLPCTVLPDLPPPDHRHPLKLLSIMTGSLSPTAAGVPAQAAETARVLHRLFPALDVAQSRAAFLNNHSHCARIFHTMWDELDRLQRSSSG
ncbi:hypothetical protein C8Q76DRAFT_805467 [Earliella scabrosa]|nr:hypothetical protein C8Q76DRAFT_805467 [Earliella scabrosa]